MGLDRAWLEFDSDALRFNLSRVREMTPQSKVMAVIKANGYGHDMIKVAHALAAAEEFAVTDLNDLERLRNNGIDKAVSLLSATYNSEDFRRLAGSNVSPVIYSIEQIELLNSLDLDQPLNVWLKVDTGMGRLGFDPDQAAEIYTQLKGLVAGGEIKLMTHLANADCPDHSSNAQQIKRIEKLKKDMGLNTLSILNSAGVCAYSSSAHEIVRPGLMLYGMSPLLGKSADQIGLKAAMTLKANVISVKKVCSESSVGYGSTYIMQQDSRVAVVSIGYADGYPRCLPSGTPVIIGDYVVPLIGRVSMDMIMVDIQNLAIKIGDAATLWGPSNPIEAIAELAGTVAYELSCGVMPRVMRVDINR